MNVGTDTRRLCDLASGAGRAGRLGEAQLLYEQAMGIEPENVEAVQGLAIIRLQLGDAARAIELLGKAVLIRPESAQLHANLGIALAGAGSLDPAIARFRRALELSPDSPQILLNLGTALKNKGAMAEAVEVFRSAILIRPTDAVANYKLAGLLRAVGDLQGAIKSYQRAIEIRPDFAEAHGDLGNAMLVARRMSDAVSCYVRALEIRPDDPDVLNNLAVAFQELGRLDEAVAASRQAIALRGDFAEAYYNLGRIQQDRKDEQAAGEAYSQAVAIRPNYAEALNNLAMTLQSRGQLNEAISKYAESITARATYDDPWINIGVALKQSGRIGEAIAHYEQILSSRPGWPEARWNLGMALLLSGDYQRGWPAFESRREIAVLGCNRRFSQPEWKGEDLRGKTILIHAEQGYGDAIQFIRYMPMVAQCGGRVILQCHSALARLFAGQAGIDQIVSEVESLPAFDVHAQMMSLAKIFGTTLSTIPEVIQIIPSELWGGKWVGQIETLSERIKVGIVWAGNPRHVNDRERSIPAELLRLLGDMPGVRFVSLQKETRQLPPASLNLIDFTAELSDFADTAALISKLDLVICVDTAVAHLAGTMGKPVWLLLPFAPDWRWMLKREDSPWYPSMRLFRQPRWGDWQSVISTVAAAIAEKLQFHDPI
jgi:tetratricopeptide (TPR) repeat protein